MVTVRKWLHLVFGEQKQHSQNPLAFHLLLKREQTYTPIFFSSSSISEKQNVYL